ncbi:hypothetical protein K488DRAFT_89275 [Vararia minispora EC-137]|uniref:Uncharacterized protein n=1 Tax=Vararia minispora EC-137 TaxID=1314806 RepID=A0ACB8QAS3_9AGAM|nr:hypothetical protein K488DRAFT_89275 [Vararia minispora EC-137]
MARRHIKVVQPGLVYIIEWSSGWEPDALAAAASRLRPASLPVPRSERWNLPTTARTALHGDDEVDEEWRGPVYVASRYFDWEHFSSVRNLRGPHAAVSRVRELPPDEARHCPGPACKVGDRARCELPPLRRVLPKAGTNSRPFLILIPDLRSLSGAYDAALALDVDKFGMNPYLKISGTAVAQSVADPRPLTCYLLRFSLLLHLPSLLFNPLQPSHGLQSAESPP